MTVNALKSPDYSESLDYNVEADTILQADLKDNFESNTDGIDVTLEDVLMCVMDQNQRLSSLPSAFCIKDFFLSLVKKRLQASR